MSGAGAIDLGAGRFDDSFHLRLNAGDAAELAPLIAPLRISGLTVSAGLSGALDQPRIDAIGRIDAIAGEGFTVRQADWTAGIVPRAGGLAVSATAVVAGLRAGETDTDALIGGPARLSLDGSLDRAGTAFAVSRLALVAPAASLIGAGTLDLTGNGFTGSIEATLPELAAFAALIGPDVAGRVHLRADIDADDGRPRADIAVDTAGVRSGIRAADALLGTEPTARARAAVAADGAIRLEDIAIDGAKSSQRRRKLA